MPQTQTYQLLPSPLPPCAIELRRDSDFVIRFEAPTVEEVLRLKQVYERRQSEPTESYTVGG